MHNDENNELPLQSGSNQAHCVPQQNCTICSNPNFKSICNVVNCVQRRALKRKSPPKMDCQTEAKCVGNTEELIVKSYPTCDIACCVNCGQFHNTTAVSEVPNNAECQCQDCAPDKRLDLWQTMLNERECIADRIMRNTGKRHCELLFNRCSTVDERDKQMVKRILEQAERQQQKRLQQLRDCERVQTKVAGIEITGLPAVVKEELLGENWCRKPSSWVNSASLQQHMQAHKRDIKQVVGFFPDIENLQVIGRQMKIDVMLEQECGGGCFEAEISVDCNNSSEVRLEVERPSRSDDLDAMHMTEQFERTSNSSSSGSTSAKVAKADEMRVIVVQDSKTVPNAKDRTKNSPKGLHKKDARLKKKTEDLPKNEQKTKVGLPNLYAETNPAEKRIIGMKKKKESRRKSSTSRHTSPTTDRTETRPKSAQNDIVDKTSEAEDMVDVLVLDSSRHSLAKTTSAEEQQVAVQDLYTEEADAVRPQGTNLMIDVQYLQLAPDITIELTNNIRAQVEEKLRASLDNSRKLERERNENRRETRASNLSSAPQLIDLTFEGDKNREKESPRHSGQRESAIRRSHSTANSVLSKSLRNEAPSQLGDPTKESDQNRDRGERPRHSGLRQSEIRHIYSTANSAAVLSKSSRNEPVDQRSTFVRNICSPSDSMTDLGKCLQKERAGRRASCSPSRNSSPNSRDRAKRVVATNVEDCMEARVQNLHLATDLIQGIDRRGMNSMIFESYVVAPSESFVGYLPGDDSTERIMARTERRMRNANNNNNNNNNCDDCSNDNENEDDGNGRRMMGSTSAFAKLFMSRNGYWSSGER